MKIVTVLGARPQFIKAAPVSRAIAAHNAMIAPSPGHAVTSASNPETMECPITEHILHTGQHYDRNMSRIFFEEMAIPEPHIHLGVGSASHGKQTAEMLIGIEAVLQSERPDCVLVYGDTNSTLAGALAACKLHIPVAHIEAGLRSYNRAMPEEHNRVLTDHCADLLFCPSQTAVDNLEREGVTEGVHLVGDTMYDAVLQFSAIAEDRSTILETLNIAPGRYYLATVHRPYNTDAPHALKAILSAFQQLDKTVVFPVHPRTRHQIEGLTGSFSSQSSSNVMMIAPVGYLDMLMLEKHAAMILTDSGGMQKEAYFLGVPCITLRPETEWIETVESGWNRLVGADAQAILNAAAASRKGDKRPSPYGDGAAATTCVRILSHTCAKGPGEPGL